MSSRLMVGCPLFGNLRSVILYSVYAEIFAMNFLVNHRINREPEVEDAF
jgi:hypothetical protein